MNAFSNPHADAMGWFAQKIPNKRNVCARNGRRDVSCGVSKTYWEDLGFKRCREKCWTKGKDASPVGCCALRVDHNSLAWVLLEEGPQICKFCILRRFKPRILESAKHGAEQ